jgi:hypothetical protein
MEQFRDKLTDFKNFNVLKQIRVFQSVFYFLGSVREQICERDTNMLEWKIAKEKIDDAFFKSIADYQPFGPKLEEFKLYQKLRFIKKNVEGIEPEFVDEYSVTVGRLYRWMLAAIELREMDVSKRRNHSAYLRKERQFSID